MSDDEDQIPPEAKSVVEDAASLVEKGVLSHRQFLAALREALIVRSAGLPEKQVLHNDRYGGFELSQGFLDFVRLEKEKDKRMGLCAKSRAELIPKFGELCAARDPEKARAYKEAYPEDFNLQIGLKCASGSKYCALRITKVPALCDYKVRDDDGMQTVVW